MAQISLQGPQLLQDRPTYGNSSFHWVILALFLYTLSPYLCLFLSLQPRCETFSSLIPQENSGTQSAAQNLFHLEAMVDQLYP